MRLLSSALRLCGFAVTATSALALGIAGLLSTHDSAQLPTVRLSIPPGTLMPVVATLLLSWTLHDRWPSVSRTAVRAPGPIAVARLLVTMVICALPAAISAHAWGSAEPVAVTLIGVGLTSIASAVLGSRVWLLVLAVGYVWLRHAALLPPGSVLTHEVPLALLAAVTAAIVLLLRLR